MSAFEGDWFKKSNTDFVVIVQNSWNAFTYKKKSDVGMFSFKIQVMSVKRRLLPLWRMMMFLPPVGHALKSEPEL